VKVAVVGVTGLVGSKMLQVLAERKFPVSELIPVASESSVGKKINFNDKTWKVVSMQTAIDAAPNLALFSAGGSVSKEFAPKFAAKGTYVVDNSSAWRMEKDIPLLVPEVNPNALNQNNHIIANPNCSTIQMLVALKPLHDRYRIKRIVVSTYQSVTGTGQKAVEQMNAEREGRPVNPVYPHPIDRNILPHIDVFLENGYTKEEMKLVRETKKILSDNTINVTATAVRVPIVGGHSEAVNVEFSSDFDVNEVRSILQNTAGVVVQDNTENFSYPMPIYAEGKDAVFVGRIRRDESQDNTLNMWIVADNLRKGAATNTVQIAEYLVANHLV